ncbi:hypothetical protein MLD38_001294 [Melastoma candidum]|nr:hypothetical protein MLD38_001294 [Melastoma candidum]
MVSQEIEVQSPQRMDNVKDLARDSVEVYKVAEPTVSGQLSGECKKKLLLGSDTGKYHVPLKKEGYKCKDCGKIFAIHQALGGHRAKFKSGSCHITEKSENDAVNEKDTALHTPPEDKVAQMVSVTEAALRQPDHKCPTCGEVFSSGQALGGHKRRHYSKQRCHSEQE